MLLRVSVLILLGACSLFSQDSTQYYELNASKNLIGTVVDVKVYAPDIAKGKATLYYAFREIERIDSLLAWQIPSSEISAINSAAGVSPVKISFETFSLLERSISYSRLSSGVFDITIGPLTQLWGFNGDSDARGSVPLQHLLELLQTARVIREAKAECKDTSAFLLNKGMSIDLGGIGKGYAIDRASAILKKNGLNSFLFNAGGDILVSGMKNENQKWVIGIKHPRDESKLFGSVELTDLAIATSGDYERYFEHNGVRYHHIIDPSTGFPATKSTSVSIVAESAERADALATILFITHGNKLNSDVEYLIIDNKLKPTFSPKFKQKYSFIKN
ncbi:hypothetical protein MASR1M107_00520 [Ignavibacteriales bacterium]